MQKIIRFKCDFCSTELEWQDDCLAHEKECIRNPAKKSCYSGCQFYNHDKSHRTFCELETMKHEDFEVIQGGVKPCEYYKQVTL